MLDGEDGAIGTDWAPPSLYCAASPSVSGSLVPLVCGTLFCLPGIPFPPSLGPVNACVFPESRPSICSSDGSIALFRMLPDKIVCFLG